MKLRYIDFNLSFDSLYLETLACSAECTRCTNIAILLWFTRSSVPQYFSKINLIGCYVYHVDSFVAALDQFIEWLLGGVYLSRYLSLGRPRSIHRYTCTVLTKIVDSFRAALD